MAGSPCWDRRPARGACALADGRGWDPTAPGRALPSHAQQRLTVADTQGPDPALGAALQEKAACGAVPRALPTARPAAALEPRCSCAASCAPSAGTAGVYSRTSERWLPHFRKAGREGRTCSPAATLGQAGRSVTRTVVSESCARPTRSAALAGGTGPGSARGRAQLFLSAALAPQEWTEGLFAGWERPWAICVSAPGGASPANPARSWL